jgi:hypothetical protein
MSDVHQCPYCELRFPNRVELSSHISFDHPGAMPEEEADDDTRRSRPPGGPTMT